MQYIVDENHDVNAICRFKQCEAMAKRLGWELIVLVPKGDKGNGGLMIDKDADGPQTQSVCSTNLDYIFHHLSDERIRRRAIAEAELEPIRDRMDMLIEAWHESTSDCGAVYEYIGISRAAYDVWLEEAVAPKPITFADKIAALKLGDRVGIRPLGNKHMMVGIVNGDSLYYSGESDTPGSGAKMARLIDLGTPAITEDKVVLDPPEEK